MSEIGTLASTHRRSPNSASETSSRLAFALLVAPFSIAGFALILLATSRHGPGISPDSVNYIAAARDFLHDGDMRHMRYSTTPDGTLKLWPPLFPFLIALVSLGPGDFVDATKIINAAAFASLIAGAGVWLRLVRVGSSWLVIGLAASLFSYPVFSISIYAWSEPTFSLWLLLTAIALGRYLERGERGALILAALFTAAAAVTRYIGLTLIGAGMFVVLWSNRSGLRQAVREAAGFTLVAGVPIGIWMVRNEWISRTATGGRGNGAGGYSIRNDIHGGFLAIGAWIAPTWLDRSWRVELVVITAVIVVALALWIAFRPGSGTEIVRSPYVVALAVVTGGYLIDLPYSVSRYSGDLLGSRFLAPVAIPLSLLIVATMAALGRRIHALLPARAAEGAEAVLLVLAALWLLVPYHQVHRGVDRARARGAGGYAMNNWADSAIVAYVKSGQPKGILVSNYSDGIVFRTDRPTFSVGGPGDREHLLEVAALADQAPIYLIWVTMNGERRNRASLDDVKAIFDIVPVHEEDDGVIYEMSPRIPSTG